MRNKLEPRPPPARTNAVQTRGIIWASMFAFAWRLNSGRERALIESFHAKLDANKAATSRV